MYELFVGWWVDSLFQRKCHTEMSRGFERDFAPFLERRGLRMAANGYLDNFCQAWFNGRVFVLRSDAVELKFVFFASSFSAGVRDARSKDRWWPLNELGVEPLAEALSPRELIEWLDRNWERLPSSARRS